MNLSNEDIQEILQILDASSFDELHLKTDQFSLTLRRSAGGGWTASSQVLSDPTLVQPPAAARDTAAIAPETAQAATSGEGLIEVRTHLPGTFYRAPRPGAAPFVEVGSRVQEDTVVCIVETMKLMNSIHAGARGTVAEICLENAQFIEKDTVLMRIKPEDS